MEEKDFKIQYRPRGFASDDRKSRIGLFWIVLICVATVMLAGLLVFMLIVKKRVESVGIRKSIEAPAPAAANSSPDSMQMEDTFKEAEAFCASGNYQKALESFRKILSESAPLGPLWEKAVQMLNEIASQILSGKIPVPEKVHYTIQKGDTLGKISKDFNTPIEMIQKSNSLAPDSSVIFPGKTLLIYKGDWNIVVDRKNFLLYFRDGENTLKVYKVDMGRQDRTPVGVFEIRVKEKQPVWYSEGKAIPYGEKGNILGTRWMSLNPVEGTDPGLKGYGIHGTWEPDEMGKASSNGCIRMRNEDVEDLYSIVPYKTKVIVKE